MDAASGSVAEPVLAAAFTQLMLKLSIVMVLMIVLIMSALFDYREHRIPNFLSLSGWVLGPLLYVALWGMMGLKLSLLGFAVVLLLTFPLWLLGWLGAGDVKLMGSVGALVGSSNVLLVLLCIALSGLVFSISVIAYQKVSPTQREVGTETGDCEELDSGHEPATLRGKGGQKQIPYAIPIAFGTLIGLYINYQ
jgi:prepilin peptidase CpaA